MNQELPNGYWINFFKRLTIICVAITTCLVLIGMVWSWLLAGAIRPEIRRVVETVASEERIARIRADSLQAERMVAITNIQAQMSSDRVKLLIILEARDNRLRKLMIRDLRNIWKSEREQNPRIYGRD